MNRTALTATTVLLAAITTPAGAAGGGNYTSADVNSSCNIELVGVNKYGTRIGDVLEPGENATGFARVDQFRPAKGCYAQRVCYKNRDLIPARYPSPRYGSERRHPACGGNQGMVVITVKPSRSAPSAVPSEVSLNA